METIKYATDIAKTLREHRKKICFSVINRGKLWYDSLTSEQMEELKQWYNDWLNVTETFKIPKTPEWINNKVDVEEVIL